MKTYIVYLSIGHAVTGLGTEDDGYSNAIKFKAATYQKCHSVSGNSVDPGILTYQFCDEESKVVAEFPSSWVVAIVDESCLAT